MTQITEGMKLCVLAEVDEEGMWKCLVSAKGKEVGGVTRYALNWTAVGVYNSLL